MPKLNDLGNSFLTQLYKIITGGDTKVPAIQNRFVSWCMPGIPFVAKDFQFAEQGVINAATAEEAKKLLEQEYLFSTVLDFIPDRTAVYKEDQQQTIYSSDNRRLSKIYNDILQFSKVANDALTPEDEAELKRLRDLLFKVVEIKDVVSNKPITKVIDGPLTEAYNEYFTKYEMARSFYTSKYMNFINASGADGKALVMDWTLNEPSYYQRVQIAQNEWVTKGYKNEKSQIDAKITQMTQRSLVLWKQELSDILSKARRTNGTGFPYYPASIMPGNFANSDGWTNFGYTHENIVKSSEYKTTQWGAGVSVGVDFGLFSIGAGGDVTKSDSQFDSNLELKQFSMSFEFVQVLIYRPWFYPEFFASRAWDVSNTWNLNYKELPSDGQNPPNGNFIAYPTKALFVRNVKIKSTEFSEAYKKFSSSLDVKPSVNIGWGPFRLKVTGEYKKETGGDRFESTTDGETLEVPGMQLIGFVNNLIPKAPNPSPEIKEFV